MVVKLVKSLTWPALTQDIEECDIGNLTVILLLHYLTQGFCPNPDHSLDEMVMTRQSIKQRVTLQRTLSTG